MEFICLNGFYILFLLKTRGNHYFFTYIEKRRISKWIWWKKWKMYKNHFSLHEQREMEVGMCDFHWRNTRNHHKMTNKTQKTILERILDTQKKSDFSWILMIFQDFSSFIRVPFDLRPSYMFAQKWVIFAIFRSKIYEDECKTDEFHRKIIVNHQKMVQKYHIFVIQRIFDT